MADFLPAFHKTASHEWRENKKYSNTPGDLGGETYCGISRVYHPEWNGWEILDAMYEKNIKNQRLETLVQSFYFDEFWIFGNIDSQDIADNLFDWSVNSGVTAPIKTAQRVCCILGNDALIDGNLGPRTISAINACDKSLFNQSLYAFRVVFYLGIAERNSSQRKFLNSWLNRCRSGI